jgi:hypothetical protein
MFDRGPGLDAGLSLVGFLIALLFVGGTCCAGSGPSVPA